MGIQAKNKEYDLVLGFEEAEQAFGISSFHLRALIDLGLPHFRVNQMYFFHRRSFSDFCYRLTVDYVADRQKEAKRSGSGKQNIKMW